MVTPGLYLHNKSGNKYRVLFVAPWWSVLPRTLQPDHPVYVATNDYGVGLLNSATPSSFMTAKWSGNDGGIRVEQRVVIYIALYGDGRVAARTEKEFEERVDIMQDGRVTRRDVVRFERIGD